jgi:hypothetical protein
MSEQSENSEQRNTERFVLEIEGEWVLIIDTEASEEARVKHVFGGPDRLIKATRRLEELNAEEAPPAASLAEHSSPQEFLNSLPSFARRQRLHSMLVEVTAVEDRAVTSLAEDRRLLNQPTSLRVRLEKALEGTSSPLSATETAQNVLEAAQAGKRLGEALRTAYAPQDTQAYSFVERLQQEARAYTWDSEPTAPLAGPKPLPY